MAIPKHYELRIPTLQLMSGGRIFKAQEFRDPLAKHFNLTEDKNIIE